MSRLELPFQPKITFGNYLPYILGKARAGLPILDPPDFKKEKKLSLENSRFYEKYPSVFHGIVQIRDGAPSFTGFNALTGELGLSASFRGPGVFGTGLVATHDYQFYCLFSTVGFTVSRLNGLQSPGEFYGIFGSGGLNGPRVLPWDANSIIFANGTELYTYTIDDDSASSVTVPSSIKSIDFFDDQEHIICGRQTLSGDRRTVVKVRLSDGAVVDSVEIVSTGNGLSANDVTVDNRDNVYVATNRIATGLPLPDIQNANVWRINPDFNLVSGADVQGTGTQNANAIVCDRHSLDVFVGLDGAPVSVTSVIATDFFDEVWARNWEYNRASRDVAELQWDKAYNRVWIGLGITVVGGVGVEKPLVDMIDSSGNLMRTISRSDGGNSDVKKVAINHQFNADYFEV